MPIYEYECDKCGEVFEVNQKITAKNLTKHNSGSKCGGPVRKLMSSNSFQLKGTGWFKTDYAQKSPTKGADSKKETATPPPCATGGGCPAAG